MRVGCASRCRAALLGVLDREKVHGQVTVPGDELGCGDAGFEPLLEGVPCARDEAADTRPDYSRRATPSAAGHRSLRSARLRIADRQSDDRAVSSSSHAMVDARGGDSGRCLDGDRCDCGRQLPGPRRGGSPSRVASAADRHTCGPEAKADQLPRDRRSTRPVTALDAVAVAVVVAAVVAMAIWFLFFSGGGIGPGTV